MVLEMANKKWWGRVAFGAMAVVFGLAFLLVPGFTLEVLIYVFGFFMILGGVALVAFSRDFPKGSMPKNLNLVEGIIYILVGVIALLLPGLTALWLLYLVAIFAILSGILQLSEGFTLSKGETSSRGVSRAMLMVSGVWSLLIGVVLAAFPGEGILALLWIVGAFLVVVGLINLASGLWTKIAPSPAA